MSDPAHPRRPRTIEPLVSTEWLSANAAADDLVIVDVRSSQAYGAGHVPGALNEPFQVPFSAWVTMRDELLLELPDRDPLFDAIGKLGIEPDTRVVVVSAPNSGEPPAYGLANAARVAVTLLYAGVKNVAILDGGFSKWQAEGRPTSVDPPPTTARRYAAAVDAQLFVSREHVERCVGRVPILDARDAEVYFGRVTEPFAARAGHIPSASSLPAPWVWRADGTYLPRETLAAMADGVIRRPPSSELIVYCGVGGYTSVWVFLLTQLLGYEQARFYDGSAQEWARHNELTLYRWE